MNRKQQVARVQFCVAVHLRKVEGKKMEMVVCFRVLCVELLGGRETIYANKIQIGSMKDIFLTRFVLLVCAAGADFDSSGDSEKAVHPLRWEETS